MIATRVDLLRVMISKLLDFNGNGTAVLTSRPTGEIWGTRGPGGRETR
jgi:hypothetical protein